MNEPIVLWNGMIHHGMLHAFAENGGEVGLEDGCSVQFSRTGDFIKVQVLHRGKGNRASTQSFKKKGTTKKKKVKTLEIQENIDTVSAW